MTADTLTVSESPTLALPVAAGTAAAVVVPTLLAYNVAPSATFFNQATSLIGWGFVLLALAVLPGQRRARLGGGARALLGALAVAALSCVASMAWCGLPSSLGLSSLGMIAAAALTVIVGATLAPRDAAASFQAVCQGLALAGVLSVVVAIVQVFIPGWADGTLIAGSAIEGRATGNLRQPNHLSSLLLWSGIAVLWLAETQRLGRRIAAALLLAFVFALVLAASRTGIVGVGLLALWGALDRRLSRFTRSALMLAPLAYLVFFGGLALWSHFSHEVFGGESRLSEAESPNSRLNIWFDTLVLIARHPWLGVGFGEFNFAWSLTPFPHRPTAFFDHTHDLPLQLAVEMGVPLALLALALLVFAWWRAYVAGRDAAPPEATLLRAAFMMVLMIAVHSLLEYPLWYAYFLLPTAFVWGICLGARQDVDEAPGGSRRGAHALAGAALAMLVLSIASVVDYGRVAAIFIAEDGTQPLATRIAQGERSWFFAHHAYYAAATTADHPSEEMRSFRSATHYLLDTRLMMAWATAWHEAGDEERARHIAARLREFRNEDSKAFFAVCDEAPDDPPFQCQPPTKALDYRDFR